MDRADKIVLSVIAPVSGFLLWESFQWLPDMSGWIALIVGGGHAYIVIWSIWHGHLPKNENSNSNSSELDTINKSEDTDTDTSSSCDGGADGGD